MSVQLLQAPLRVCGAAGLAILDKHVKDFCSTEHQMSRRTNPQTLVNAHMSYT
jgi:thermostable 8-oxoguanine DNA glycosylase